MAAERAYVEADREPVRDVHFMEQPMWAPLHWGSIVGGWLIGFGIFAFLSVLGIATGLTAFNAGAAAATGTAPATEATASSALRAAISSLIAYLAGGFLAARIAGTAERDRGAAQGLMVFLLSVPFALLMAGIGTSGVMSSLGGLAGGIFAGTGGQAASQAANTLSPADVARLAEAARNAAWGGLVIGLVCLAASALGGYFGAEPISTRHEVVRHR